jgi:hypothetical protein
LFSSASADDKQDFGDVAWKFLVGAFCNLTINPEAPAKYLNDALEKSPPQCWLTTSSPRQWIQLPRRHQLQESAGRILFLNAAPKA